jgi:hypothetical protein
MTAPKAILIESDFKINGIQITYVKSKKLIRVFGWHGSTGLMDIYEISLQEFCERLGIKP